MTTWTPASRRIGIYSATIIVVLSVAYVGTGTFLDLFQPAGRAHAGTGAD